MIVIRDCHDDGYGNPTRWTFGTGGVGGRFAGAFPDGTLRLHSWVLDDHGQQKLVSRVVKCASFRKAVRRMRR